MRDLQHKQNSQKNIIFFKWLFFNICLLFAANTFAQPTDDAPFIVVLGIAQDAGFLKRIVKKRAAPKHGKIRLSARKQPVLASSIRFPVNAG